MKQSLQSLLLPAIVASALVTAWFDSFLIPSWVLVISATVSLAVWLCFRPGASSRQRSGNRSSLLPLVAVATVILVSMMNPSHIAETTDKTGKLPSDTPAEKQQFSPAPNHFAALPGTVDVLKTRNRAIALAAIVCLSAATGALGHGRPKTVKLACWIITLSGVAVAAVAYHYKSTGTELLLGRFETPNPRFYGPFRYNNYWTAWNILAASTSSALLLDALHRRRKLATIGAVLSIFILAIAVSASESRSALLVSGVFAIYLCAELSLTPLRRSGLVKNLDLNFKKIFLVGTAVTVLAGLVVTVTVTSTWHRWATPEYAEKQSGRFRDTIQQLSSVRQGKLPDLRPAMARDTIKMALAKPVWGWGLGSFEYAFPQYAGPEFLEDRFQHETNNFGKLIRPKFAHNDWAQYWAELGTIGFVALLLAITRFVAPAIRRSTPISPPPVEPSITHRLRHRRHHVHLGLPLEQLCRALSLRCHTRPRNYRSDSSHTRRIRAMNRYKQILGWLTLTACIAFLASQLIVRSRSRDPVRAAIKIAESVTGDNFKFSSVSPSGAAIHSVNQPSADMVTAIDSGLDKLFTIARSDPYNFDSALRHSDYIIFVATPDRLETKQGTYSPDIAVAPQQYAGSSYDEDGRVYVAGMVLALKPCVFVVANHTKNFARVSSAVRHEGEHLVLYHNDRNFYARTADHSKGGGHPILK